MVGTRARETYRCRVSSGIVGVVLWGTIIVLAFFLLLVGREVARSRREGPREHLREPVLRGWDETSPPKSDGQPR